MKQPNKITVYSKGYCPFCKMAKATLNKLGLRFEELDITNNAQLEHEMKQRSKRRTVPQIFINEQHIGGNDDLQTAFRSGELARILEGHSTAA